MRLIGITRLTLLLLVAAMCWTSEAGALQEEAASGQDVVDVSGFGQPEPATDMERQSGRQGIQIDELTTVINSNESKGYVDGNYLESFGTGANSIAGNAFSNASGIATVIQNSGNQVLIQNSLILNLTTQ